MSNEERPTHNKGEWKLSENESTDSTEDTPAETVNCVCFELAEINKTLKEILEVQKSSIRPR